MKCIDRDGCITKAKVKHNKKSKKSSKSPKSPKTHTYKYIETKIKYRL